MRLQVVLNWTRNPRIILHHNVRTGIAATPVHPSRGEGDRHPRTKPIKPTSHVSRNHVTHCLPRTSADCRMMSPLQAMLRNAHAIAYPFHECITLDQRIVIYRTVNFWSCCLDAQYRRGLCLAVDECRLMSDDDDDEKIQVHMLPVLFLDSRIFSPIGYFSWRLCLSPWFCDWCRHLWWCDPSGGNQGKKVVVACNNLQASTGC